MQIAVDRITALATAIVRHSGASETHAETVAKNLVGANLAGHDSHGVGMLPAYMKGIVAKQLDPVAELTVEQDRGPFLMINGNCGYGQVIGEEATKLGIAKAREMGVAVVGLKNSYHIGRIGAWGEMCAAAGFISIHYVNALSPNSLVAPFGGTAPRFSTNPYCTALPATAGGPAIVLDMATSQVAQGKVRVAYNKGLEVPEGSLIDHEGVPTNDPSVMFEEPKGALRTMGLHKGFGLAVICELLAGAFVGGITSAPGRIAEAKIINNMLMVIIDPDAFGNRAEFEAEIDQFSQWVKSSPPAKGVEAVMVPGDPERKSRAERAESGLPIDDVTWEEILSAGEAVGLSREEAMRIVGN